MIEVAVERLGETRVGFEVMRLTRAPPSTKSDCKRSMTSVMREVSGNDDGEKND